LSYYNIAITAKSTMALHIVRRYTKRDHKPEINWQRRQQR